jgi:hypothetical protein
MELFRVFFNKRGKSPRKELFSALACFRCEGNNPVSKVENHTIEPEGKQQHLIEVLNFVDTAISILLSAQAHDNFHAETTLEAVVQFLQEYGLPQMLTFDRDPRFVGSAGSRDFPSALTRFLLCVGIQPNILPPQHPELNGFVEWYHCKSQH